MIIEVELGCVNLSSAPLILDLDSTEAIVLMNKALDGRSAVHAFEQLFYVALSFDILLLVEEIALEKSRSLSNALQLYLSRGS